MFLLLFALIANSQALFEECNHIVPLEAGQQIYINSPYYPNEYPLGTSCRYHVQAPTDYELKFKCDIKLNTPPSDTRCRHEALHFNPEGDELLTDSEYFCGNGNFERKSFLNRAVISYISTPPYKRTLNAEAAGKVQVVEHKVKDKQSNFVTNQRPTSTTTTTTTTKRPTHTKSNSTRRTSTTRPTPVVDEGDEDDANDDDGADDVDDVDGAHEDGLTDEVLHALNDAGMSDALAYMATLLYNENDDDDDDNESVDGIVTAQQSNNGKPIRPAANSNKKLATTTTYLDKLPAFTWRQQQRQRNGTTQLQHAKISKTSVKRARIVAANVDGGSGLSSSTGTGGGRFSCLVTVVAPACECGWSLSAKIAGAGTEAAINEFPSMAGVQTKSSGKIFCGAAIIHQRYLLTAAHCFISPATNHTSLLQVVVGEHDVSTAFETLYTRLYDIEAILPHEHFSASSHLHNDIALLRTTMPIAWNRNVGPACLPWRTQTPYGLAALLSRRPPFAGQRVDTAGWGTTSFGGVQSKRLLKTTLDVIDVRRCRQLLATVTPAHTFCTFTPGRDTCQYDSGGALYDRSDGRLMAVGIVSYGYACATNEPAVNTRIASYVKWIKDKTPDARYCVK